MEEERYTLLDKMCNTAVINLYSKGGKNGALNFKVFDEKKDSHLAMLYIAGSFQMINGAKIYGKMSWFRAWKLRKKTGIEIYSRPFMKEGMDIEEMIDFMETETEHPGIFTEIYHTYYGKEIKK